MRENSTAAPDTLQGISGNSFEPMRIGGFTRLPYPSNLILDIHSYCNASCKVCPYPEMSKRLAMGRMSDDLFRKIVDEFSAIAGRHSIRGHILFCNMGELFVDPRVFDMISYVLKAGLKLVIQTNAALLTPERTDRLIATGYRDRIYVSCHGITPRVYRNVMGLDIARTLANIDYLLDRYPRRLVQIRAIPFEWPLGEVLRVKRYWKDRGVTVKVFLPNARTGLVTRCLSWRLKYPGDKLRGCKKTLPLRDMVIAFNGDAVLCCEDMGRKAVLGNVAESSLVEVWNSPKAREALECLFEGRPSGGDFICKRCEFGISTRTRRLVKVVDHEWHRLLKCYV